MQEKSILGGSVFRTCRRAHDLQVIGKVSSRVEIRILSSKQVTSMSILRKNRYTCFAWAGGTFFTVVRLCQFLVLAGNRFGLHTYVLRGLI